MISVLLPQQLESIVGSRELSNSGAQTVRQLIEMIDHVYSGVSERLLLNGELRKFINIYVNGEDIRFMKGLETLLTHDDEVSIIPATAGG